MDEMRSKAREILKDQYDAVLEVHSEYKRTYEEIKLRGMIEALSELGVLDSRTQQYYDRRISQ